MGGRWEMARRTKTKLAVIYPGLRTDTHLPSTTPPMDPRKPFTCSGCFSKFRLIGHLRSHQRQSKGCSDELDVLDAELPAFDSVAFDDFDDLAPDPAGLDNEDGFDDLYDGLMDEFRAKNVIASTPEPSGSSSLPPKAAQSQTLAPPAAMSNDIVIDVFSGAGKVIRKEASAYDRWCKEYGSTYNPYHPFKSKLDWEVARWAKQEGPGASALDRLLKFDSVCYSFNITVRRTLTHSEIAQKLDLSFASSRELNQIIDHELEPTTEWRMLRFKWDGLDGDVEVPYRNPVDIVKDLFGNPTYCDKMHFAPERQWVNDNKDERIYNEMKTGNWWWRVQVRRLFSFPSNAVISAWLTFRTCRNP